MALIIVFGLHLDGQRAWHDTNCFGRAVVGPVGLLNLLESVLGLPKSMISEGERLLQYRALLAKCDHEQRFYHRSFQADSWSVARTLLGWRDQWRMEGWNGVFAADVHARLVDMADVEQHAIGKLSPGIAERINAVSDALRVQNYLVESVELVDAFSDFPAVWRRLLNLLNLVPHGALVPAESGTTLSMLQQSIMQHDIQPVKWVEDGTLLVLRAHARVTAARMIGELCARNPQNTLLLVEQDGGVLDVLSSANGNASLGVSERSSLRPALQLIPLAFSLLWQPLDPYALLEFLIHPLCPLPRFVTIRLARAVAEQPGIGGEKWCTAIEKIRDDANENADFIIASIHEWLFVPKFQSEQAVPVALLEDILLRITASLTSKLGSEDLYAHHAQTSVLSQCVQIARALSLLRKQGIESIARLDLKKLFDQVISGDSNQAHISDVGGCLLATHPAACIETQDTVIWWNLVAPIPLPSYPWYKQEMDALHAAGVTLPTLNELAEAQTRNWLQPLLAARKQLILALPNEREELHPIWLLIERAFGKNVVPVLQVEDVLADELTLHRPVLVQHQPLPALRRWWNLGENSIEIPQRHSFSSLDKLINNPSDWVLRYAAHIDPPKILSIPTGNRLLGTLAHRIVELLYQQPGALQWTEARVLSWVNARFCQILQEEGAVLLLPGQRGNLAGFDRSLVRAIKNLHSHLQVAGIVSVEPEKSLVGKCFMGSLGGNCDILVKNAAGNAAVLDLKWTREKDYQEMLRANKQLQLAIYGELHRQEFGDWAVPAYYIFDAASLYAQDRKFFPGAMLAKPEDGDNSASLWLQAQETMRWRRTQMQAGRIELVLKDTEQDINSLWPEGALAVEVSKWSGDYVNLTGWGKDA